MLSSVNIPAFKFYFFAFLLRLVFAVGKVLNAIPLCTTLLQKLFLRWTKCRVHPDDFWQTMFSCEMEDTLMHIPWRDTTKKARPGELAINVPLVCLDGKSLRLLDFQSPGRPLVVRLFQQEVDFLVLYIEEVHPANGWAFKNNYEIRQHRTIQQRWAAAKLLQRHCPVGVPVVVDTMWNTTNVAYGATPERLYVIKDSRILYQGGVGPFRYDLSGVSRCLYKIITGRLLPA